MFTAAMERHAARRLSIAMVAIAGVALVGAGALAVGGEGRLPARPEPNFGPGPDATPDADDQPARPAPRPGEYALNVADGLAAAYDWPADDAQAPDSVARDDGSASSPDLEIGGSIRYLGSIIGPDRRLAILSINGKQRILAEGGQGEGISLVRVFDERVIIRDASGSRQIDKAAPAADLITVIAGKPEPAPDAGDPREEADSRAGSDPRNIADEDMMNLDRTREELRARALERAGAQQGRGAQQRGGAERNARMQELQRNTTTVQDGVVTNPGTSGATTTTPRGTDDGSDS